jgi:glucosamine 6-phosphate synthetase-like amidotransferase/phosphosugar isomerase protein
LAPIASVAACRLFAYHMSLAKGLDVETQRGPKKVTRTL